MNKISRLRKLIKLNEEDYELTPGDKWLRDYVQFGIKYVPNQEIVEEIYNNYGVSQNTQVYRGINFNSKEAYDAFIEEIQAGSINNSNISSWAKDPTTAEEFARSSKNLNIYSLDLDVLKQYEEMEKSKENITGYKGIVIATTATPENSLCDVTNSRFGIEDEIILMPGDIPVTIYKELQTFKDTFEENDVNDYIQSLTQDTFDQRAIDYILQNEVDNLIDDSKHKLYELLKPQQLFGVDIKTKYDNPSDKSTGRSIATFEMSPFLNQLYSFLSSDDQGKIKDQMDKEIKDSIKDIKDNNVDVFQGVSISEIGNFANQDAIEDLKKVIDEKLKNDYQQANDEMREDYKNNDSTDYMKRLRNLIDNLSVY